MDWIERLFGLSPDGGSGAFEVAIVVVLASVVAAGARLGLIRLRNRRR